MKKTKVKKFVASVTIETEIHFEVYGSDKPEDVLENIMDYVELGTGAHADEFLYQEHTVNNIEE